METVFDRTIFPVISSSVGEQNPAIVQWVLHQFQIENFHRNNFI